jgi:hydroxymethylbilane synthase
MKDVIVERFGVREFVPAPCQGAIATMCRADDDAMIDMLKQIEDRRSRSEVIAERALIKKLEGGCRFPIGAVAVTNDDRLTLYASVFSADGSQNIKIKSTGKLNSPEKLGIKVADTLLKKGAMELAEGWRGAVQEWNNKI